MNSFLNEIVKKIKPRRIILLESTPDFSDNTKAVYDYLVKHEKCRNYRFVWFCYTPGSRCKFSKNTRSLRIDDSLYSKTMQAYYLHFAKCMISCNRFLIKRRVDQFSFYLTHGAPVKSVKSYYTLPEGIDFMITSSEYMNDTFAEEFNCSLDRCKALGFPRNDIFKGNRRNLAPIFGDYDKYIVWYPTVRQFKSGLKTGIAEPIPIIHSVNDAIQVNEAAKERNVLIVLKPHFAQDVSYIKKEELSNIRFIDDDFLVENHITSYQFVSSCDALITDYSSIYFDFLLCDKPIGLVWEDIKKYKENPGVVRRFDELMQGGQVIYNADQFCSFINDVVNENDRLKTIRNQICEKANYSRDGKSAKRVADFIIETANL